MINKTLTLSEKLAEIKKRADEATEGPWSVSGNLPFYVDMRKPSPSLSKHDSERPTYWRVQDAEFVLNARTDVPKLLAVIEKLIEQRNYEIHRSQDLGAIRVHAEEFCNEALLDLLDGEVK